MKITNFVKPTQATLRHSLNGAVIARCSQPEVGWLGWRSADDEELIKAISQACNFDRAQQKDTGGGGGPDGRGSNLSRSPESQKSNESLQITSDIKATENCIKVLIMDARSYTTAVANRARGGGCECPEYYPNCEIRFMNLANIHSIRKSFHALRQLCAASGDQPNWFTQLEGTRWLLHMSGLMNAAVTLVTAIDQDGRPVLVHCSDGWDRTPQIVALAELLLDPYYRTLEGFRILIEREWLAFGHKFADRCGLASGSDDQNERCPVFLQWLDCVHQVVTQFPCAFEFSQTYLVKLAQHTYSNLFGTFLCNTQQERLKSVNDNTFSVWDFLDLPCFRNYLYTPVSNATAVDVLWPQCDIRDLKLWKEVYIGSMEANFNAENGPGPHPGPSGLSPRHMTKTRSYGDLKSAEGTCPNHYRRCSDPSINCDSNLTNHDSEPLHASSQVISIPNGHTLRQPDFYPSDLEDADCKQDCLMFDNNSDHLTDDQIDGLDQADFEEPSTSLPDINDHVTNGEGDVTINLFDRKVILKTDLFRDKPGIAPRSKLGRTVLHRDLPRNENGILKCEVGNSSKESENSGEDSLSRNSEGASSSQNTKCETTILSADVGGEVCGLSEVERSVETSTETLVSEKLVCR
ncbi:hypothetical protein NQ314_005069 [Rhamnusium bicolor]|uniref:Phosphatidylinositol-3-phosphatase n=1 Tax=Rhamnusium bicolor TaxID=1586634 RepID=A0AAV8ZL46_9CUCU|nr:hypothetical protein NQ314_005069 [Rhamnusium bicolor]